MSRSIYLIGRADRCGVRRVVREVAVAGRDVSEVMSWLARRSGGWRRLLGAGLAACVAAGGLVALPPVATRAFADDPAAGSPDRSVPVSPLAPAGAGSPAAEDWLGSAPVWPTAASAVVDLSVDESGNSSGVATVGGLPVTVSSVPGSAAN